MRRTGPDSPGHCILFDSNRTSHTLPARTAACVYGHACKCCSSHPPRARLLVSSCNILLQGACCPHKAFVVDCCRVSCHSLTEQSSALI
eukprot:7225179-Prymnesium_polylepis.2